MTKDKHILVVDDEVMNTALLSKMITHLGYTSTTTTDSLKALDIFSKDPSKFDLILADQTMPNLKGSELCIKIKAIREDVPFIIITGTANMDFGILKEAGIKEVILKPVRLNAIKDSLAKYLQDSHK